MVTASFAELPATTYTVTPSAGTGGSISPSSPQTVEEGATTSFTLTPNSGYEIAAVGGTCGGTLSGSSYTTAAVTQNCIVNVLFRTTSATEDLAQGGLPISLLYVATQESGDEDNATGKQFCGQAVSIPSTSSQDRIWINQSEGVHLGESFTIEARVLVRSYSSSAGIIVDKYRPSGNQREFRFSVHSDGRLRMWYSETGSLSGVHIIYSDAAVPLNEWTHVATSYGDGKLNLFINGVLERTEEIPTPPTQSGDNRIVLGGNGLASTSRESIDGLLDEVRLSDVSRYNTTFTIPTSEFTADENTLLLFHFTDGLKNDGNVAGDGILSGNAEVVDCN